MSSPRALRNRPPASGVGRNDLATPAQVRAIYLIGRDQHALSEIEVDARAMELYGRPPPDMAKGEASRFITALRHARDLGIHDDRPNDRLALQAALTRLGFAMRRASKDAGGQHAEWWWHGDGSHLKINWSPLSQSQEVLGKQP